MRVAQLTLPFESEQRRTAEGGLVEREGRRAKVQELGAEIRVARSAAEIEAPAIQPAAERSSSEATPEKERLAERAQTLAALIRAELGKPVRLKITDNKRLLLSQKRAPSAVEIRAHHVFLRADERVQRAAARFLRDRDPSASAILDDFLKAEADYLRSARIRRPSRVSPRGRVHDLDVILRDVVARHFDHPVDQPRIGWGRAASAKKGRKRSIRLGVYDREEALIRIHRALDRDWVPAFYVGFIVYHELLHHLIPPVERGGRLYVHTPEFRRLERKYHYYAEAIAFERENLNRLLAR